ncbi:MAG: DUF1476 domain-containing protein [Pseudomonadota bacterium]
MTQFDNRERAFENKFAHDAEMRFKAEARRNRKLGEWISNLLGYSSDETAAYVSQVIKSDFEEAGDEDVFRKLRSDLDEKGVQVSDRELRAKMDEYFLEAKDEILNDVS